MTVGACSRHLVLLLAVLATALGGCANENSIFRTRTIMPDRPTVLTMDAKQRSIVMVPGLTYKQGGTRWEATQDWKVCAEAAPDVFSALSTSAGADLAFGQSDTQVEAKAKAALAIAEAAGTIERTQTINLLRESMYRTCERYMSGALEKSSFVVQAGRDARAMVAILAIEQLTRAARPPSTVLVAGGTSTSISSATDIVKQLVAAKAEERVAEDALTKIKADAAQDCTKVEDTKKPDCETAKKTAADGQPAAELRLKRAQEDVEDLRSVSKSAAIPDQTGASTTGGTPLPGGNEAPRSASDLAAVATVVKDIASQVLNTNEMQLFCIQYLSGGQLSDPTGELRTKCLALLSVAAGAEQHALQDTVAAMDKRQKEEFAKSQNALDTDGETLKAYLKDDAGAATKWPPLVKGLGLSSTNADLEKRLVALPITLAAAVDRFKRLVPADYRPSIITAIGGNK